MNTAVTPITPSLIPPMKTPRYTAAQWDAIRAAFNSSILADTPLVSLAKNLEGADWPLNGPNELPAAYIELTFAELRETLALRGQPPSVADHLISILEETLAFDTPFGEMLTQSTQVPREDNPLVKNLAKLKIAEDFPVGLMALSADALQFCQLENIRTVGEFALAAQRMAGTVIVGGDFRALLNAISCIDEVALARYLPFRPGATGLHYLEGLAQAVRAQPAALQAALALRAGFRLKGAAAALGKTVVPERVEKARAALELHAGALRGFCTADYTELQRQLGAGVEARRLVVVLGDPATEAVVADLIAPAAPSIPGFWARFMLWLKR